MTLNNRSFLVSLSLVVSLGLWSVACTGDGQGNQSVGAKVYSRQCGHCHRLYEPEKMNYESWKTTVKRMKRRFEPGGLPPLSPSDEVALLEYLRLHSK